VKEGNAFGYIGILLTAMPVLFILLLRDSIKIKLLQSITSALALVLFISLFFWLLFLFGLPIPHSRINFNDGQYWFDNYYFFLSNLNNFYGIPRFSSIFIEPGHLGIITSFLLYANKFELRRKEVLILFIATLFTLSLAAYLLLIISAFVFVLLKSKKPTSSLILLFCLLTAGYYFSLSFNNGSNVVNNVIIERLQYNNGDIVGNNRFSSTMDSYFEEFIRSDNVYIGIGNTKYKYMDLGANAGYKVFLVQYGIIGTLLLFLFYLSLIMEYKSKLAIWFLFIYSLSFLQASYALWASELIIFITAMPLLKLSNKNNFNEK
jgi:hypothetical protein